MTILDLLRSDQKDVCLKERSSAISELSALFPDSEWGIEDDFNFYSEANIRNIWKNELRRSIRNRLESEGVGEPQYGRWLGDVHFLNIGIYRKSLFERYRSNAGWRLVVMALPQINAILIGLASHYQNAQNHNKLGEVSNLLFDIAKGALEEADQAPIRGRKISSADWDQDGLFPSPVSSVAGVSIDPDRLYLKDMRTTTLKKILASFVSVKSIPNSIDKTDFHRELSALRDTAKFISSSVFPFGSIDEFEAFRALALNDLAAARTRHLLRQKSSTRSFVRVYYGPPGTGKTLTAVQKAIQLVEPGFDDKGDPASSFEKFNEYREQCAFVTFHPSLQYEDLVESVRPLMVGSEDDASEALSEESSAERSTGHLNYRVHEGTLLRMIRRALQSPSDEFVMVIDEINRGDISRILGPLISSLDADKRVGAEFPIGIELQYPRAEELESRLYMPSNLHLLGTMNSSDRNIALVDHALRRRFEFINVPPNSSLLRETNDSPPIDCGKLLRVLNERIEHLLDADHCIGHGYLMSCKSNQDVIESFASKIIPLLREYFYGNEGLVLLVLGDNSSHDYNFFRVDLPEKHFTRVFGIDEDEAATYGYRPHSVTQSLELDDKFWNPTRLIPGPEDEHYAVECILKLCGT